MRGDVSLAELYRTMRELRPDAEAARMIVRLLELDYSAESPTPRLSGGFDPSHSPTRRQSRRSADRLPGAGGAGDGEESPAERGPILPTELETLGQQTASSEPPAWLQDPAIVALAAAPRGRAAPIEPEPLFAPGRARAILGAALAVDVPEGDLDVDELTRLRATLQAVERLPRRPIPSVRHGAQILLDHSSSMAPYRADRTQIAEAISRVLGRFRSQCLRFRGCPTRGVEGPPRYESARWRPPPRRTVVAVVSDLGIGAPPLDRGRADRGEWIEFAALARSAGCPVVVFVPFAPHRWDPVLARVMTFIHWDRATTARAVRLALRDLPERRA